MEDGPGMCGMAVTPSVALDGYFMKSSNHSSLHGEFDENLDYDGDKFSIRNYLMLLQIYFMNNWQTILFFLSAIAFLGSLCCLIFLFTSNRTAVNHRRTVPKIYGTIPSLYDYEQPQYNHHFTNHHNIQSSRGLSNRDKFKIITMTTNHHHS